MKEINLLKMSSSPAPDEWKDLPEVKEQRPTGAGYDVSLQRLDIDGIDICLWEIKKAYIGFRIATYF